MSFDISEYIPHAMIVAFASVSAWVFRDHVERDDRRFETVAGALQRMSDKLDEAVKVQASSHSEILKILLEQNT